MVDDAPPDEEERSDEFEEDSLMDTSDDDDDDDGFSEDELASDSDEEDDEGESMEEEEDDEEEDDDDEGEMEKETQEHGEGGASSNAGEVAHVEANAPEVKEVAEAQAHDKRRIPEAESALPASHNARVIAAAAQAAACQVSADSASRGALLRNQSVVQAQPDVSLLAATSLPVEAEAETTPVATPVAMAQRRIVLPVIPAVGSWECNNAECTHTSHQRGLQHTFCGTYCGRYCIPVNALAHSVVDAEARVKKAAAAERRRKKNEARNARRRKWNSDRKRAKHT